MEREDFEQGNEIQHYPWLRNLFFVVLYAAIVIFLWHFPTEGGRQFFQNLLRGIVYILAGLAVVGVALLLFMFILPVFPGMEEDEEEEDDDEYEEYDEDEGFPLIDQEDFLELLESLTADELRLVEGRSVAVPALQDPQRAEMVLDILHDMVDETDDQGTLIADRHTGVIMVEGKGDEQAAARLLRDVRTHLRREGIKVRQPRC